MPSNTWTPPKKLYGIYIQYPSIGYGTIKSMYHCQAPNSVLLWESSKNVIELIKKLQKDPYHSKSKFALATITLKPISDQNE